MRDKRFIFVLLGLAIGIASIWAMVQSQQPEKPVGTTESSTQVDHFETILIGKGGAPKWSPDGEKLAFISGGWLYVADADGKGEMKKVAEAKGRGFDWLDSNTFLTYEKQYTEEKGKAKRKIFILGTLTMEGEETLIKADTSLRLEAPNYSGPYFLKDGTVGYYEGPFHSPGKDKVFKALKTGRLKPEQAAKQQMKAFTKGDVWLRSIDGSIEKKITSEVYYRGAQLSPDGAKIATKIMRGDIVILDTLGNELANIGRGVILKRGRTGCWSPDSKQLVYNLPKESEYDIEESEIFIVNWDGTGKKQITDTPDEIELEQSWSPDGTKIACVSDNTGNIFVINVK